MSCRNSRFELRLANEKDSGGIQKVFDDAEFGGKIAVRFSRAPDPYQSLQNDGESIVLPVACDMQTGEIVGVGGCVLRTAFINGTAAATGYLTGMKLLRSYRGGMPFIRQAFELIHEQTRHLNPFYYTTILKSNTQAVKLLEKPRKGMPAYRYEGEYTVFCLGTGPRMGHSKSPFSFQKGETNGLSEFYTDLLPKYNLAPTSEWLYGLNPADFYTMRGADGGIIAACALWNQQSYKQYIITGYSGVYKTLRRLPTRLFGYPTLPNVNITANYASIALLAVRGNDPDIARQFLRLVATDSALYGFLLLGLFENHPLQNTLRSMRHIRYESRLYTVDFGGAPMLGENPIMLEVGLL